MKAKTTPNICQGLYAIRHKISKYVIMCNKRIAWRSVAAAKSSWLSDSPYNVKYSQDKKVKFVAQDEYEIVDLIDILSKL